MKQEKRYKSVFTSIFFSYLGISVIVLIITLFSYVYFYRLLENQLLLSGSQQAELIATELDGELNRLNSIAEQLSSNRRLVDSAEYTDTELSVDTMNMTKLISELKSTSQIDARFNTLVYFRESHSLLDLNTRRYNTKLMDLFVESRGLSMDAFKDIVGNPLIYTNYVFENGTVWLIKPVYRSSFSGLAIRGVVILEFHLNDFLKINSEQTSLAITGADTVLYSSGSEHGDYYYAQCDLPSQGWQCRVGLPKAPLLAGLRVFRYVLILEIVVVVALALLLSWRIAARMYSPIACLMDSLNTNPDVKFKDVYLLLNNKLNQLMADNRRIRKSSEESKVYLVNHQINQILNGTVTNSDEIEQAMQTFAGIRSAAPWVMVLVRFHINENSAVSNPHIQGGQNLELFVLKNIVDELIFSQYAGNICWQGNDYYLFVSLNEASNAQDLTDKLQYLKEFYRDILYTSTDIVIGSVLYQTNDVADQREMLLAELQYHLFWADEEARVHLLSSSKQHDWPATSFSDYTNACRKLINLLESKDYLNAVDTLDYIFSNTFSRDPKYLKYNVYRMYGLSAMLSMAILEQAGEDDQAFLNELAFEEQLLGARNFSELIEISRSIITRIVEHNSEKDSNDTPVWLAGVLAYIEENYTNPNLSVAEIADKFWLSLSHLSRSFKAYMNHGVLEHIQMLRIGKAKQYLAEGKTINETAVLVGYQDARALSRIFKNYEGITPGKYRENVMMERDQ